MENSNNINLIEISYDLKNKDPQVNGFDKYLDTKNDLNIQRTSENNSKNEGSGFNEEHNKKNFEYHKVVFKNESTIKPNETKCSPLSENNKKQDYLEAKLLENHTMSKKKEFTPLGKKRLTPDTPNYKLNIEGIIENISGTLTNKTQFLNNISLFYGYNSIFKINKDFIKQEDFIKQNLDKTFKEILLMKENIGPQEKEAIENKMKSLIELEKNSSNLNFFKDTLKMKLSDLVLNYIYDRINRFKKLKSETLKDSKYSEEEKKKIIEKFPKYLENQKGISLSTNEDENSISLPKVDTEKKNHDLKPIFEVFKPNKFEIITIGNTEENLTRISVEECLKFLSEMIEKIINPNNEVEYKLQKIPVYSDISGNSSEKLNIFFNLEIWEIFYRTNKDIIDKILERKDRLKETEFLKALLKEKFLFIINKFIDDEKYICECSNGDSVVFKTLQDVKDGRIKEKREIIKNKLELIIEKGGRIRKKREKNHRVKGIKKEVINNPEDC